ncbi:MAG: hypothetical protein ACXQTM_03375 [Methanosarcinales archaeon]
MSSDRDILIERLENELYSRDKFLKDARESIDRLLSERERDRESLIHLERRVTELERRVANMKSGYDGVMRELLDQKSLIHAQKRVAQLNSDDRSDVGPRSDNIIVADDSDDAAPLNERILPDDESEIIEI